MVIDGYFLGALSRAAACACLALALAACGGEGDSSGPSTLPVSTSTPNPTPASATTTNSPPVLNGSPALTAQAGTAYSFSPNASDADNDPLVFTISGLPAWASFNETNGTLSGTPRDVDVGQTDDIEITVSDGKAQTSVGPFRITVAPRNAPPAPSNNPPTISGSAATMVNAGSPYMFVPSASDADNDTLTFSIVNRPQWATFNTSNGQLSGTPTAAQAGVTSNIQITVSDGKATASLPAFSIEVKGPSNTAPVISGTPPTSVQAGAAYSFQPSATDADNDTLTWSITNKPSWATFSATTGNLSGNPSSSQVGAYSNIVVAVSDGKATVSLAAFTITVAAAPAGAPTISGTPSTTVTAGSAYSFQPTASGSAGSDLTFSIQNNPTWATFNTATGMLSGTPAASDAGTTSNIVISVSDGTKSASLAPFSITVNQISNGSAVLNWTAPTQNTDGSSLVTFAGYQILYGTSATGLTQTIQVTNPTVTTYTVPNLASGTWYFSLQVYLSDGTTSVPSSPVSVVIP
jgi:hypothetical protein